MTADLRLGAAGLFSGGTREGLQCGCWGAKGEKATEAARPYGADPSHGMLRRIQDDLWVWGPGHLVEGEDTKY